MSKTVRTRFAPSPTGYVHLGSLRTALFAFLFARHNGGVNVLRIEDTDQSRKVEGAVESLLGSMHKLGVEFDEGAYVEHGELKQRGEYGPYIQSERLDIYKKHIDQLIEKGGAYYCFCSPEQLEELRKEQIALKKPAMYNRACRELSKEQVEQKLDEFKQAGKSPVVRQAIPTKGKTIVDDLVFGKIEYDHQTLDDQILLKSDGFPTYHLAVVVDDHLMQITHVIRGDEWIPSTPKHILLFQAFGWELPQYAHLPLILNPDKTKLSKRQGDVALEDYLQKGYLPEAMLNFMALLGWNPKTEQEIFSLSELIQSFDLEKVNKAGAVFDINKLDWMNAHYIKEKSNQELLGLLKPYLSGFDESDEYLLAVIQIEKERLKKLSDITENTGFYFAEPTFDDPNIIVWKKADAADAKQKLAELKDWLTRTDLEDIAKIESNLKEWIANKGYDNGSVLWPLRVSLSGLEKSPSPFELLWVLNKGFGKEGVISRLDNAIGSL